MTNIVICGANGKMGHTVAACIAQRTDCKVIGGIDVYTKAYGVFPIVEQPNLLPEKPQNQFLFPVQHDLHLSLLTVFLK